MTTKQELKDMTDQQLNILLADKLGVKWVIHPEDNVDEPWAWRFSELGKSFTPLPDYASGCKEVCALIIQHNLSIAPMGDDSGVWCVRVKGGTQVANESPWRGVVEYLLLEGLV